MARAAVRLASFGLPIAFSMAVSVVVPAVMAAFSTACSRPDVRKGASAPDTASEARVFVWVTGGEGGTPSTYALSAEGAVIAHMPGIRILAAGTEWTVAVSVVKVPTQPCHDGATPPGEGRAVRVVLEPADPSRRALEIVSPSVADDTSELEQSARILGSVGPFVFVEDSRYAYTCGAHGNTGFAFAVWNVDLGRTVDVLSDLPDHDGVLARGKAAVDAAPDAVDFTRAEDPATITELVPRLDESGRLHTSALVSVPTCYACTRGGWSSYTASAEVPTPTPERLRALGTPPRAVAIFAAQHAGAAGMTIGGYSIRGAVRDDRSRSTGQ
jgi:hypothetical protein